MPTLSTERLLLRALVPADAPRVEQLAGDRRIAETTLTIPHPYPEGTAVTWIEGHQPGWEKGERLVMAVCLADAPDEVIGAVGLAISQQHSSAELGYWIGVPMWGRGYATEASRAIMSYGFDVLNLHRIEARHFVRNPASGRVMVKLGMQLEGVNRDAFRRWDRFEDSAVYAILKPDWKG